MKTKLTQHLNPILRQAADDGGDGGGAKTDDELPKTKADLAKIINNSVNSALTNYIKRGAFAETITGAIKTHLDPALEELTSKLRPPEKTDSDPDPKVDDATKQALAKLKADNDALHKRLAQQDETSKVEKETAQRKDARAQLERSLTAAGVSADRLAGAAAFLFHDRDSIKRNEQGEVCMEFRRDWGKELVPIEKGVEEWAATAEGKAYLPPAGGGGSGNTGGRPPGSGPKLTGGKQAAAEAVGEWMLRSRRGGSL